MLHRGDLLPLEEFSSVENTIMFKHEDEKVHVGKENVSMGFLMTEFSYSWEKGRQAEKNKKFLMGRQKIVVGKT